MDTFIEAFKAYEAHDVPEKIMTVLKQTIIHMRTKRIDIKATTIPELLALTSHATNDNPMLTMIDLIMPLDDFKWDPLTALRRIQRLLPTDTIRYISITPSLLMYGHHAIYIATNQYYILLLSNYDVPLVYTEHIFVQQKLQEMFPLAIETLLKLKNSGFSNLMVFWMRLDSLKQNKLMDRFNTITTLTNADINNFPKLVQKPTYDG